MLKKILKLEGAQQLTKKAQQHINGGGPIGGNCRCFCYIPYPNKVSSSCFRYCPDGTIPGLEEGSSGNCQFPY